MAGIKAAAADALNQIERSFPVGSRLMENVKTVRAYFIESRRSNASLRSEVEMLKLKIDDVTSALKDMGAEHDRQNVELMRLKSENMHLRSEVAQLNRDIDVYTSEENKKSPLIVYKGDKICSDTLRSLMKVIVPLVPRFPKPMQNCTAQPVEVWSIIANCNAHPLMVLGHFVYFCSMIGLNVCMYSRNTYFDVMVDDVQEDVVDDLLRWAANANLTESWKKQLFLNTQSPTRASKIRLLKGKGLRI